MTVIYHCQCNSSASPSFVLNELYFCEECDAIKCPECVLEEVASYYCPNCLFEVPTASVRAEKSRCARNCFLCPECTNTLSVVASDPVDPAVLADPTSAQASIGEPPYYLACLACRWDSRSNNGITFEKPTGLAAQLQKLDDTLPHHAIYEQLRDHIEPYLRKGLSQASSASTSSSSHQPTQAIAAAARALSSSNSTLGREIPSSIASASRFNSLHNLAMAANASSSGRQNLRRAGKQNQHQFILDPEAMKDDMKPFVSEKGKNKAKTQSVSLAEAEKEKIGMLRKSTSLDEVVGVDRRWAVSHDAPLRITELKPQRIPLKSRRTKRCNGCRHILIKPDPKASTKYRIRFLASTYVPAVTVHRRIPASLGGRISASSSAATAKTGRVSSVTGAPKSSSLQDTLIPLNASTLETSEPLRPGRNYSFTLTFANPLYEVIQVQTSIIDPPSSLSEEGQTLAQEQQHWTASLPCPSFDIGAFAEDWEYENDVSDNEDGSPSNGNSRKKRYPPGMLAKKANKTVVLLDLATGRVASGNVKVYLRVDYTYTAEEALSETAAAAAKTPSQGDKATITADPVAAASKSDVKTFSFTTSMVLGRVVPRPTATGAGAGGSGHLDVQQARRMPSSSDMKSSSVAASSTASSS